MSEEMKDGNMNTDADLGFLNGGWIFSTSIREIIEIKYFSIFEG